MSHATIRRIRQGLIAHGLPHAVALFREVFPLGGPETFITFILGKSCRIR